jgi:hypothetical protein
MVPKATAGWIALAVMLVAARRQGPVIGGVVVMGDAGAMTDLDCPATIDLAAVRADTPGCQAGAFLDSAGSSLPPRPVVDTVVDHLRLERRSAGTGRRTATPRLSTGRMRT